MAVRLVAGQNSPVAQRVLRFELRCGSGWDLSALVVAENLTAASSTDFVFYNQAETGGVRLVSNGVDVDLDGVSDRAHGVLCIASVDPAAGVETRGVVDAVLTDSRGSEVAAFTVPWHEPRGAVICFELYRRAGGWKVRAVGQGYVEGLPHLLAVHGVEVDDDGSADDCPSEQTPERDAPARPRENGPILVTPSNAVRGHELITMIFEDAARSTSALLSAREYAAFRLDQELSEAVADAAGRHGPAAQQARAEAHRRYDALMLDAQTRYDADARQLSTELTAVDDDLPRSLSSWDSVRWRSANAAAIASDGIRVGQVRAVGAGSLAVPFCMSLPLRRPLWIDAASSAAAAPVVAAVVLRLLAATPVPAPILDVVDLSGAMRSLTDGLGWLMGGDVVRTHQNVSAKLADLVRAVDLSALGAESGVHSPARVVVLSDFGYGLGEDDVARIATLATQAARSHLSMVIVGADDFVRDDPVLHNVSQICDHLPVGSDDARILDPWTRNEWLFTPDSLPAQGDLLARLISSFPAP